MAVRPTAEESLDKRAPISRYQFVDVTFSTADEDVLIRHDLRPPNPEAVRYQVIRQSAPGIIYQDLSINRKAWQSGHIYLRSAVPTTARIIVWLETDTATDFMSGESGSLPSGGGGGGDLDDLTDVATAGAANGNVLTYDSGSGLWVPAPPSMAVVANLVDLNDVNVGVPTDGQVLAYDAGTLKWVAVTITIPTEITLTGSGHPQGAQAADVGRRYRDTSTGRLYRKMGGGSTAYGWYPELSSGTAFGEQRAALITWIPSDTSAPLTPVITGPMSAPTNTIGGSATRVYESGYGWLANVTTGAIVNSSSSQNSTFGQVRWFDDDFDFVCVIKTGSDLSDVRMRIGITTAATSGDTPTQTAALFRYSTSAGDGGWVGQTCNGVALNTTVTAPIAAIAVDTFYKLRIRFIRSTGTVYFSIDDGTETAVTTDVPGSGSVTSFILWQLTTLAAAAKAIRFKSIQMVVGQS